MCMCVVNPVVLSKFIIETIKQPQHRAQRKTGLFSHSLDVRATTEKVERRGDGHSRNTTIRAKCEAQSAEVINTLDTFR